MSNLIVDEDTLPSALPFFEYDFNNVKLISNTFVNNAYDIFATAFDPRSPYMLEAKVKTGDSIAEELQITAGEYISCRDVNMVRLNIAILIAPIHKILLNSDRIFYSDNSKYNLLFNRKRGTWS